MKECSLNNHLGAPNASLFPKMSLKVLLCLVVLQTGKAAIWSDFDI